jgi:predicted nucleic acid-binding protein
MRQKNRANMPEVLRVFLDANILFSASLKEEHRFLQLWKMRDLIPMTSPYAVDEVQRNCIGEAHAARLVRLLGQTHLVSDVPGSFLPPGILLSPKDAPILVAAIFAGADYLITGDKHHFGRWMNSPIRTHLGKLIIQEPAPFLVDHKDRLR